MKRNRQTFTVEGQLPFPLDMLRYDCCWPLNQSDVQTIEQNPAEHTETKRIQLERYVAGKDMPTEGRWKSFGWSILNVETFK